MNVKQLITVPRIIGIILIVIAALAYTTQGMLRTAILAIAGLVLLLSPKDPSKKHWQHFLHSLKLRKEFALIMLYDIIFWALAGVLSVVFAGVMRGQVESLKTIQLGQGFALANLGAYNDIIKQFFATAIIGIVIFYALIIAAYALSRGLIWLTLLDKPAQTRFFVRFGLLNLLWCTFWIAVAAVVGSIIISPVSGYILIALFILYAHLTTVLHCQYTKMRAFGTSLKDAFSVGLGQLGSFVQPYCYLFVIYVILSQLERLFEGRNALIVTFIIFLVFMAWYRTYLRNIIRSVA